MENELSKAALEAMSKMWGPTASPTWQSIGPISSQPVVPVLASFADAPLIFEMLSRGYAVARIPAAEMVGELAK